MSPATTAAAIQRRAEKAEGMAFARAWKATRRPIAVNEHMPFAGHRSQAEVAAAETRSIAA